MRNWLVLESLNNCKEQHYISSTTGTEFVFFGVVSVCCFIDFKHCHLLNKNVYNRRPQAAGTIIPPGECQTLRLK